MGAAEIEKGRIKQTEEGAAMEKTAGFSDGNLYCGTLTLDGGM